MPVLSHEQIIKGYWEKSKHQYPDLTYEVFEQMCKSPFQFFREEIKSGRLHTISIKGLGKFQVFKSTIKKMIVETQMFFDRGWIDEIVYEDKMGYLTNHLNNMKEPTKTLTNDQAYMGNTNREEEVQ
jgi:hypothetical protein